MKPRPFEYRRAANLAEVYAQLSEHGDSAKIVAGGQSLVPMMNLRLVSPSILLDIGGIDELRGIALNGDMLRIGALVRHCEMESSPLISRHAPLLAKAVEHVAHLAIRNRGTFGGSCCHADPAAEFPACSLLLGAVMEIASVRGTREVAAADFFHGPFTTAVQPDELLLAIHIPAALPDALFAFHELSHRLHLHLRHLLLQFLLVALDEAPCRHDRFHSEKFGSLRRLIARGPGAVFVTG